MRISIKYLLPAALAAATWLAATAIPAHPRPARVAQPGGDSLTVVLHGDEFYHYYSTTDGYTLLRDASGAMTYARQAGTRLESTGIAAHDPADRDAAERAALATLATGAVDHDAITTAAQRRARRDNHAVTTTGQGRRRIAGADFDYDKFKGLIVLINYSDKQFVNGNEFYDSMVNESGYSGFYHNGQFKSAQGSMRDYFIDQSNGAFDPHFDIYGPVDVDYTCTTPNGTDNCYGIFTEALTKLDSEVDFSQYDTNGDGQIDMIYFIVAGYSANYSGNNSGYLWPHAYYLFDPSSGYGYTTFSLDGCSFWRYACSTEIYGWESYGHTTPLGIGTMCHEFSHVLGLPDLYDTDYAQGGGQSVHPEEWDLMAGGSSADEGRRPVGYSLWERAYLGFAQLTTIEGGGNYTLEPLQDSRQGYYLASANENEYFLLENRQQRGWDAALPGHGMVIARVDESNMTVWNNNKVNCNPKHNYYALIHADGTTSTGAGVPFPGSAGVFSIGADTNPALATWNGLTNGMSIMNINEAAGVISFTVRGNETRQSLVEDFETMALTSSLTASGAQGRWATWTLSNCDIMAKGSTTANGEQSCGMITPGSLMTEQDLYYDIASASATVFNTSASTAKLNLYYSVNSGATWTNAGTVTINGSTTTTVNWNLGEQGKPLRLRLTMSAGTRNKASRCFIDDLTLYYYNEIERPLLMGDANGDGVVDIRDVDTIISYMLESDTETLVMVTADVDGDGEITVADLVAVANIARENDN